MICRWCRDCKDLTIEITNAGADKFDKLGAGFANSRKNEDARRAGWKDWSPKLDWMFSLENLVLITNNHSLNYSRLLEDLCDRLFPPHMEEDEEKTILPLRCLWMQGYEVIRGKALGFLNPKSLQSFNSQKFGKDEIIETVGLFPNLENLCVTNSESHEELLLKGLEKLKFYCGIFNDDEEVKLYKSA